MSKGIEEEEKFCEVREVPSISALMSLSSSKLVEDADAPSSSVAVGGFGAGRFFLPRLEESALTGGGAGAFRFPFT